MSQANKKSSSSESIPLVDEENAEGSLVKLMEEKRRKASSTMKGNVVWDASVEGEHPFLSGVPMQGEGSTLFHNADHDEIRETAREAMKSQRRASLRFKNLAKKVRHMQRAAATLNHSSETPNSDMAFLAKAASTTPPKRSSASSRNMSPSRPLELNRARSVDHAHARPGLLGANQGASFRRKAKKDHRRHKSVFATVGGEGEVDIGRSHVAMADTKTDRLIMGALAVDRMHRGDDNSATTVTSNDDSVSTIEEETSEDLLLNDSHDESLPLTNNDTNGGGEYGAAGGGKKRRKRHKRKGRKKKSKSSKIKEWCVQFNAGLVEVVHPWVLYRGLIYFLFHSCFTYVSIPCLIAAFVLYYNLGNPSFGFMNGLSTISWWLVFAARQALTLELARATEHFVVDGLALRSRWIVKLFGPLVTLFVIQAKGWPSTVVFWSLWDLCILHGSAPFQLNWAFDLGIGLFSPPPYNRGGHFLYSVFYLRILLSVLLAGLANAFKRTTVAMYFGKRTFVNYKPKLEALLADIVLLTEVAELGLEVEASGLEDLIDHEEDEMQLEASVRPSLAMKSKWVDVDDMLHIPTAGETKIDMGVEGDAKDDLDEEEDDFDITSSMGNRSSSRMFTINDLLDQWEEPVNKLDKSVDASIADVLTFRKALTYMDDTYPFSFSFGPASTRQESVKSAQRTFRRLANGKRTFSYDVIDILGMDEDGYKDEKKSKELKRLFRPDRNNEITMLAFVQSCDSIYKRLRFFRASVGNSSVIDKVMEDMLDILFNSALGMVLLTMLGFNPYPLLVTISSILVSFAFAFGASASMYMEGIFMIAIRRPFDLGDRILIDLPSSMTTVGGQYWYVEDINLFHTTLRMITTNEVCSVNNGSIALARIINSARSPNAIVKVTVRFNLHVSSEKTMEFKKALQKYIDEHPRIWKGIKFYQCEKINIDYGYREFLILVEHRKYWQEGLRIWADQGELMQWCFETTKMMGIAHKGGVMRVGMDTEKKFIDPTYEERPSETGEINTNFLQALQSNVEAVNQVQGQASMK